MEKDKYLLIKREVLYIIFNKNLGARKISDIKRDIAK